MSIKVSIGNAFTYFSILKLAKAIRNVKVSVAFK